MLSMEINILYIVLMTIITETQSLVEVSTAEDSDIRFAETIIRNTTNQLLAVINIRDDNWKPKLKQFFTIHDYFLSITLTDCDNLKKIVELLRVNNIDNNIQHLITKVNEVLDKSESNANDKYVAKYIDSFIGKIKHLNEKYVSNSNNVKKEREINYLNSNKTLNVTRYMEKATGGDEILYDDDDDGYWKPSGRRLYRGFQTRIKHFPFMASVHFFKKFQCAGSIIKSDLVITSASCLQLAWNNRFFRENPAFLSVQIGSDYYEHGGEYIAVNEIYFYPTYDPKTLNNNLAIMRLSRRIKFKKKHRRVKKIDIDRKPFKWVPKTSFDILNVIGWGARDSSNIIYNVLKNRLSYAELDYYPLHECRKHYSRAFVTKKNFCAGFFAKGGGACNRDSGGPAVMNGILMGVISFGSPICGSPDSPTVFTKLGFYGKWIDGIIKQNVPYIKRHEYNTYDLSYGIKSKEITKKIEILKPVLRDVKHQYLKTNKIPEKLTTQIVKVTAFIPVIESTRSGEIYSELGESEGDESNDAPIVRGTEIAKRKTVLEKLEEEQDIKNNVMALIDNLDIDKLLNETESIPTKKVKAEKSKESKKIINNLKQPSSANYLSSSNEDEVGLSTPTEVLNNLPLKILPRTYDYDKVSGSLLFEVVSQAIEEEIKRHVRERKPNL